MYIFDVSGSTGVDVLHNFIIATKEIVERGSDLYGKAPQGGLVILNLAVCKNMLDRETLLDQMTTYKQCSMAGRRVFFCAHQSDSIPSRAVSNPL